MAARIILYVNWGKMKVNLILGAINYKELVKIRNQTWQSN